MWESCKQEKLVNHGKYGKSPHFSVILDLCLFGMSNDVGILSSGPTVVGKHSTNVHVHSGPTRPDEATRTRSDADVTYAQHSRVR